VSGSHVLECGTWTINGEDPSPVLVTFQLAFTFGECMGRRSLDLTFQTLRTVSWLPPQPGERA
jgi:hypothetical protein